MCQKSIRKLLGKNTGMWVYLSSQEVCAEFYRRAFEEGFRFGNLKPENWKTDYLIGVHSDGKLGHPPYFVRALLNSKTEKIVDYVKYIHGEEDFFYKP